MKSFLLIDDIFIYEFTSYNFFREAYFKKLHDYAKTSSQTAITPLVITGDTGVGKSSLLGRWFLDLEETAPSSSNAPIYIFHFIGASNQSTSPVQYDFIQPLRFTAKNIAKNYERNSVRAAIIDESTGSGRRCDKGISSVVEDGLSEEQTIYCDRRIGQTGR